VIVTILPTSAVPINVGVVSLVKYGEVVSHPIEVIVGIAGAVVSNTTGTIPVAAFPAASVTVTTGSELKIVPVHTTAPPFDGFGVHVSPGIVTLAPASTPEHVTVTDQFDGFGVAVHTGTTGAVVSIVTLNGPDGVLSPPVVFDWVEVTLWAPFEIAVVEVTVADVPLQIPVPFAIPST
jgi:hypothetical protein